MFRKSITMKVVGILAITLAIGFFSMGLISIWLQSDSTMGLERQNVRSTASIIVGDIAELMMKGDSKETQKYIERIAKNPFLKGLKIYNAEGKESEKGANATVNTQVLDALNSGSNSEVNNSENGMHTLSIAVPMANEERCKGCHDAGPKHLGALLITASTQEGYGSAQKMTFALLGVGVVFFFLMLGTIYLFFKNAIIQHIQKFEEAVDELVTEMTNGRGDLTKTIAVTSQDEIGNLAVLYNKLVLVINSIISRIAGNAEQLFASANQLSTTSETMAVGVNQAAAQAATIAVSSQQMTATSCEIAQSCVTAAGESRNASTSASNGTAVVENTVSVMERISMKIKETAESIRELGEKSGQIGVIISTIEDIADQTNLLALNAAIEAARAGEHGRGFAVVADEVRALAERTTRATKEISEMIKSNQVETRGAIKAMEEGVKEALEGTIEANKSGTALQEIMGKVDLVSMLVNQIATAAEEQNATTNEISNNIGQISEVFEDTAKGAHDTATTALQLANLADSLHGLVGQFTVTAQ